MEWPSVKALISITDEMIVCFQSKQKGISAELIAPFAEAVGGSSFMKRMTI